MIVVIDGYNVIKQALGVSYISDRQRQCFVDQLVAYAKKSANAVIVVFDGAGYYADKEQLPGVKIVYSGYKESADDYIKRYISHNKQNDILLVSTDRDICRHAWQAHVATVDALDFYTFLHAEVSGGNKGKATDASHECVVKVASTESPELDALMREAAAYDSNKHDHSEEYARKRASCRKRYSKKERALLKKVKKL